MDDFDFLLTGGVSGVVLTATMERMQPLECGVPGQTGCGYDPVHIVYFAAALAAFVLAARRCVRRD